MKKCKQCNNNNPQAANYCADCGYSFTKNMCTSCHKKFERKCNYCVNCGVRSGLPGNDVKLDSVQGGSQLQDIILTLINSQTDSNKGHTKLFFDAVKEQAKLIDKLIETQLETSHDHRKSLLEVVHALSRENIKDPKMSSSDVEWLKTKLQTSQLSEASSGQSLTSLTTTHPNQRSQASDVEVPTASPDMAQQTNSQAEPVIQEDITTDQSKTDSTKTAVAIDSVGERRELTVLFSDLSGYTAMNESLDPEDVEDIMQEVIKRCTKIVETYDGVVNLIVGDELVVLFGLPDAHEDDAFRAVSVALEFHAMIREFSISIEKAHGIKLNLHTGIHSGLVVTKLIESHAGKYNITGDTVNTAARLLGAADTGAILISPRVNHTVKGYFNTEKLKPVSMKGKAKQMTPYRVLSATGATTRLEASLKKGLTGFVGRDKELETLNKAFNQIEAGSGQFISVMSEGGIGKSRLVHEAINQLDESKYNMLHGVCLEGKTASFQPFIEIIKSIFNIDKNDDQPAIVEKIEKGIDNINKKLQVYIPIYCHLLAINDPKYPLPADLQPDQLTKNYQDNVIQLIIDYSNIKPVVCLLDDWQFSDSPSNEILKRLVTFIAQSSVFVLVIYRSSYSASWADMDYHTHISIKLFEKDETKSMLQSVLKVDKVPDDLVNLAFDKTSGNAFYIEELCHALKEQEVIFIDGEEALLSIKADQIELPDTMQGILTTRIRQLHADTLKMLGHASVIGATFNYKLLDTILDKGIDRDKTIQDAIEAGLIEQIQLAPEPIYRFKQTLAQKIIHDNLLKKTSSMLHELVAKNIEELNQDKLGSHYEELAWHYNYSKNNSKAVDYLSKAGDQASAKSNAVDAEKHYDCAIARLNRQHEFTDQDKHMFVDLCLKLSNYAHRSATDEMFHYMNKALTFSEDLKHDKKLCQACYWTGRMALSRCDFTLAKEVSEKCYELSHTLNDPNMIGLASYVSASYHLLKGSLKSSFSLFKQASELIEDVALARVAKSQLAFTYIWYRSNKKKSLEIMNDLIDECLKAEDYSAESFYFSCTWQPYVLCSDWENLKSQIEGSDRVVQPPLTYIRDVYYACCQIYIGDKKQGIQLLNSLVKQFKSDIYTRKSMGHLYPYLLGYVVYAYLGIGEYSMAKEISLDVIEAKDFYHRMGIVRAHLVMAEVIIHEQDSDVESIKNHIDKARAIIKESNMYIYLLEYYYTLSSYYIYITDFSMADQEIKKLIKFCDKHNVSGWKEKAVIREQEILKELDKNK